MTFLGLSPPSDTVDVFTEAMNAEVREKLAKVVERHNAIIDFCTDLTRQFTVIVLMHFLSAAFVLCSTILDIMLVSPFTEAYSGHFFWGGLLLNGGEPKSINHAIKYVIKACCFKFF